MNFFHLATISFCLLATAAAEQKGQVRKMSTSIVLEEKNEVNLFQQRLRFEATALGAATAKWNEAAAAGARVSKPGTGSSNVAYSMGAKTKKRSAKTCDARLVMAEKAIEALPGASDVFPEDITAACTFRSSLNLSGTVNSTVPVKQNPSPNLDCPAPAIFGFFEEEEYEAYFGHDYGYAMRQFVKYCECHQGYELDCITKIPYPEYGPTVEYVYPGDTGSTVWKEYCTFVGIWNGDIDYVEYDKLSYDVKTCGCYFITSSAKDMVDNCAGVDLFEFLDENLMSNTN